MFNLNREFCEMCGGTCEFDRTLPDAFGPGSVQPATLEPGQYVMVDGKLTKFDFGMSKQDRDARARERFEIVDTATIGRPPELHRHAVGKITESAAKQRELNEAQARVLAAARLAKLDGLRGPITDSEIKQGMGGAAAISAALKFAETPKTWRPETALFTPTPKQSIESAVRRVDTAAKELVFALNAMAGAMTEAGL